MGRDSTLKLLFTICYRYTIHSLVVDENPAQRPIAVLFRDVCKAALQNSSQIGQSIFVYPFVYQPITARCDLRPGINHLLTMGLSDRLRLSSDGLPNRYVIQLPSMTLLYSEADLNATGVVGYTLVDLRPGKVFNAKTPNQQLLSLYAGSMNEGVQETQHHQSATNRWTAFVDALDQMLFFMKPIYQVARTDKQLWDWQKANCRGVANRKNRGTPLRIPCNSLNGGGEARHPMSGMLQFTNLVASDCF